MLLRRTGLLIPKPGPIKPAHRIPSPEMVPGPPSPLERNPQSPKGWKNRESDGVGLGIVVALGKSDGRNGPEKITLGAPTVKFVTAPIYIDGNGGAGVGCTESWRCGGGGDQDSGCGFFFGSPPSMQEEFRAFRPADFLSYCYLCRKRLHGEDIFMYRGEKAFCSMECRYQQIVSDEFHEKCGSASFRLSSDHTTSRSFTDAHRLFYTAGIAAA